MAALLQNLLMYLIVPLWLVAGLADYLCHRAQHIEQTSGLKESLLHLLQFGLVGTGLLAALFLDVNLLVLALLLLCALLHQAVAVWDIRYADATRRIPPAEQHVHGVLESLPFTALALLAVLHSDQLYWDQLAAPGLGLRWKDPSLPGWYLVSVLAAAVVLGIVPYGEEALRTARAGRKTATAGHG